MSLTNSSKIFIGSIPKDVTEEELKAEASKYGTITQMYYVPATAQSSRGWAFITYEQRSEAYKAIESLDYKCIFPNSQRPLDVRFASYKNNNPNDAENAAINKGIWQKHVTTDGHPYYYNTITGQSQWEKPKEMMLPNYTGKNTNTSFGPPGANVFVFHLPSHWTDMELFQHSKRLQRSKQRIWFCKFQQHGFCFKCYKRYAWILRIRKAFKSTIKKRRRTLCTVINIRTATTNTCTATTYTRTTVHSTTTYDGESSSAIHDAYNVQWNGLAQSNEI
ncbi:RNA-binding protein, putative [Hepatocystis sp. ex Piliocolobus tephrosceles]|nr:RNA-binding protein, putative [Hepatocystis sp. ex Piliocolobus tephrosceles]